MTASRPVAIPTPSMCRTTFASWIAGAGLWLAAIALLFTIR
jgi:hypothetical protein